MKISPPCNVTNTEVVKNVRGRGWRFNVYWNNRTYPNLISASYITKTNAENALGRYLKTGRFAWDNER